jgi:HEAT repeat protein
MEKNIEKRMKKFRNLRDRDKLATLVDISEKPKSEENIELLLKVIEEERYEKIRIKAILVLKKFANKNIVQRLQEFYSREKEKSVRLALIEVLGDVSRVKVEDFLSKVAEKDENDVIRAMALKNLHERGKLDNEKMKKLILDIIQNDRATFPKQIAISIAQFYADQDVIDTLKRVFRRETKHKMRLLLYQKISEISKKLYVDLDIEEPIEEIVEEDKKRKLRIRKKKKEEEEHLFF